MKKTLSVGTLSVLIAVGSSLAATVWMVADLSARVDTNERRIDEMSRRLDGQFRELRDSIGRLTKVVIDLNHKVGGDAR
jgi:hypothetical protein